MKINNWNKKINFNSGHLYINGLYASNNSKQLNQLIKELLKANDDRWRKRIKELIEKNKAYDFGIYDYEGIALDLINLLKEKTNEK